MRTGQTALDAMDPSHIENTANELYQKLRQEYDNHQELIWAMTGYVVQLNRQGPNFFVQAENALDRRDSNELARLVGLQKIIDLVKHYEEAQLIFPSDVRIIPASFAITPPSVTALPSRIGNPNIVQVAVGNGRLSTITFAPAIVDASLIFGASLASGWVWNLNRLKPDDFSFKSWSWAVGVTAGADYSGNVGFWWVDSNQLGGDAHGLTVAATYKGGASMTFWWDYEGNFQGFEIAPAVGASTEIEYVRGTTRLER